MIKTQNNIVSFVLRFTQELWRDTQGEPHVQWRGHIRHVQNDAEDRFTDFAEAVGFIQRCLTQLMLSSLSEDEKMSQEKILRESFKFWEQFASSYTNMMVEAMEQTVKQSEALQKRLDETTAQALKAWRLPAQPVSEQISDRLNELHSQVQALAERVESLEKAVNRRSDAPQG
jgi:murein L,D-transpeptidase YafK